MLISCSPLLCFLFLTLAPTKKNHQKKAPAVHFVGALLQALLTSVRISIYVLVQSKYHMVCLHECRGHVHPLRPRLPQSECVAVCCSVLQCVDVSARYIDHERWGPGVETQKNVRGEIGGWGRVPFNEPYAPSLSTIYDGA